MINDVPTVGDLVSRIVSDAETIIHQRLSLLSSAVAPPKRELQDSVPQMA